MREFGDYQTPDVLSRAVCELLRDLGASPKSIVEPTCGTGAFLRASLDVFPECVTPLGFDINPAYVRIARTATRARVHCRDFFQMDWRVTLDDLPEPILVVGNPPWVTNAAVSTWGGTNVPIKSNNIQRLAGLDAITGKSNFDISEWMMLRLLECLTGRSAVLAMLCKTLVARKVLQQVWTQKFSIREAAIYSISAAEHFNAAVDACLLVCTLEPGAASQQCSVYADLGAVKPNSTVALHDGRLVADRNGITKYGHLYGRSPVKWRSGVKHDCSRIMELRPKGNNTFMNGFGDIVELEQTFLYPMLKSSEVAKQQPTPSRYMLVPQRCVGDDTSIIRLQAPRTWEYLQAHANRLDKRASIIYRKRPRFSVFGVGPYSFSPWKVAISGFYKHLDFCCVGPIGAKPVVLDDTCYFLPCHTEKDAQLLQRLLNSVAAKSFFQSFIFWDAKRPITGSLLDTLDLLALAAECGVSEPTFLFAPTKLPLLDLRK